MPRRSFLAGVALGAAALAAPRLRPLPGIQRALADVPARDPSIVRSYGSLVVPQSGIYWGADDTTRGFTTKKGIETELGRRMAIRNRHYGWLETCPSATAVADAGLTSPRVIPMASLNGLGAGFPVKSAGYAGGDLALTSYGQGIDRISNGEFDGYWTAVAQGLQGLGTPVILRLFMEMNGEQRGYSAVWQGGIDTGGQTSYIAMWQHIWNVFNANGATLAAGGNCVFVFCVQRDNTAGSWKSYWPGDDYVDWMGIDLYRITWLDGCQNPTGDQDSYLWAVAHRKPLIVAESGFTQNKVVNTSTGKYDKDGVKTHHSLIKDHHAAVALNPQCVAYLSWNNIGTVANDFIDTSKASLKQYKAFANDPYCLTYRT